jgi:hypothetical protein
MPKILIALLAGGLLTPSAFPADNRIEGPVTGYFFDAPSGSVRAISGAPGAAVLSAAAASGLDAVWMAPGGRVSLALKEGALGIIRYADSRPAFAALSSVAASVDQVSWSPDGQGAVLYSSALNMLQVVTGLPDHPAPGPQISMAQSGSGVSQLRLSPLSRHVAVIVNHGAANSLYLLQNLGPPAFVDLISDAGAMDFSSDGRSLYVVDRAANGLVNVPVAAPQSAQTIALADSTIMPGAFAGLLSSRDGKQLYATMPDAASVIAFETAAWTTVFRTSLEFVPSSLERLSGSLYILAAPRDREAPVWLFDGSDGKVYFVPGKGQSE